MHAVVRTYTGKGAKELMDVLERNNAEVERLIRAVQGFVSFSLVRTASGGFSVSVFQDKAGTDESVRVAREWIAKNAANLGAAPPAISEGTEAAPACRQSGPRPCRPAACDAPRNGVVAVPGISLNRGVAGAVTILPSRTTLMRHRKANFNPTAFADAWR